MFWNVVLEKTLESPLDCKEIKSVNHKGNKLWVFTGSTHAKAKALKLWPLDAKNWLIWKDPDAGKDWRQEEKGMTEDEMVGWHHQLYGYEFKQALGVGVGQGGLPCCNSWGRKESDTTEQLNWTELYNCQILSHVWLLVRVTSSLLEDVFSLFRKPTRRKYEPRWQSGKESACQFQESQETQVRSLDQEDPLEESTATHSSILV